MNKHRNLFVVAVVLMFTAAMFAPSAAAPAPSAAPRVLKISIDDTIHPITEEYIRRAVGEADSTHSAALLIQLRTPGGLVTSTRGIVEAILASKAPVIVYIAPSGGYAASAGFFILESADIAAMAPGTNTGAAHPVVFGGEKLDDVMKMKMENDAAAFMRSFANKRGRNVDLAESGVRQSKSFTDQEALDQHLVDLIAKDDADIFRQLDGREISRFDGSKTTLHLAGATEVEFDMSLKQRMLAFLMDPNILFILFAVGMLAIYAEFNHPGAVVPGVVGLICVMLAIFAMNLLPTRYAALGMIIGAFVLFGLEAKFQSHGVLGIGGVVMMVLGALLLVDGPIPQMRVRLLTALSVSLPLGGITVFLMTLAIKAHRNKIVTGSQGMVGSVGVAQTALDPRGKIFVQGELWDAVSTVPVNSGEQVKVTSVEGLTLSVEPVRATLPTPTPAGAI